MVRILLGLIIVFFTFISTAQVVYSPDPVEVSADVQETSNIQVDFELKNEGTDTVRLAWKLSVLDQPSEWQYYVCDTEICYNLFDSVSNTERPNIIPPGEAIIVMFHALPEGVIGEGSYSIKFFDVEKPDSILVEVPVIVNTINTSTKNIETKGLKLFPNPANEYFRINTGNLVDRIDIYNVVGKRITSFKAEQGNFYDISNLTSGMYYVRLLDEKEDILKVLKLKKN